MSGRKREWSAGPREDAGDASTRLYGQDGRQESGDAIEQDLKRLRLAYNYDGAHSVRFAGVWPDDDDAMETDEMELPQRARAVRNDYAGVNSMLREFHFLRQLRKFQAERGRARASVLERRADDAGAAASRLREPRA